VAAAAFLAGSPFLLVEPHLAWRDIRANRQIVVDRAVEGGEVPFASTREYAGMLGNDATGWPVVALSVAGLVLLVRNAPSRGLLLIAFPLTFLLFIANTVAATRYLNPVLPFVAVWAGVAVGSFGRRPPGRTAVAVTLIVVAALPGLLASWRTGSFFRQMDTRTLALEYMAAHVPEGASVLIQPYSVPVYQSREGLLEALRLHIGDPERASTKFRIQLALTVWPSPAYRTLYLGRGGLDLDKIYLDYADFEGDARLEALGRHDVHYVVLKRYNDEPAAIRPLVDALGREAQRLAVFSPYAGSPDTWRTSPVAPFLHNTDARLDDALERPGPVIEIWQVP